MRPSFARLFGCIGIIAAITAFPAITSAQAVASVCKDGTSSAAKGRGACAQHGGVDAAATKSAKAAARAAKSAERAAAKNNGSVAAGTRTSARGAATVNCTDGTTGTAGRGACSHHGGVSGASANNSQNDSRNNSANQSANDDSQTAAGPRARAPRASAGTVARSSAGASRTNASSGAREDNDPAGALAQCNDGMYSHATNRRGACSRHGGVKTWLHA